MITFIIFGAPRYYDDDGCATRYAAMILRALLRLPRHAAAADAMMPLRDIFMLLPYARDERQRALRVCHIRAAGSVADYYAAAEDICRLYVIILPR